MSKPIPEPACAACPIRSEGKRRCVTSQGRHPDNCPTVLKEDLAEKTLAC